MSLTSVFTDIADAIRSKNGSSDTYTPAQMPQAIADIPTGGGGIDWEAFEADDGKTRMLFEIPYDGDTVSFALHLPSTSTAAIDWGDGTTEEYHAGSYSIELSHSYDTAGEYIFEMSNGDLDPGEYINNLYFSFPSIALAGDPTMAYIEALCIGRNCRYQTSFPTYIRRLTVWLGYRDINISSGTPHLLYAKIQTNSGGSTGNPIVSGAPGLNHLEYNDTSHKFPGVQGSMLYEINIPDGTTYLGSFDSNKVLRKLTIPDTITSYDSALKFRWCYCLEDLVLPAAITTAPMAFCYSNVVLKRVYFKGDISSVASQAFYGCLGADALIFSANTAVPTLASTQAFDNSSFKSTASHRGYIYVPDELVEDWKVATNWTTVADSIKPLSELPEEYEL